MNFVDAQPEKYLFRSVPPYYVFFMIYQSSSESEYLLSWNGIVNLWHNDGKRLMEVAWDRIGYVVKRKKNMGLAMNICWIFPSD